MTYQNGTVEPEAGQPIDYSLFRDKVIKKV
jgi:hypothetical protein